MKVNLSSLSVHCLMTVMLVVNKKALLAFHSVCHVLFRDKTRGLTLMDRLVATRLTSLRLFGSILQQSLMVLANWTQISALWSISTIIAV